MRRFRTPIVIVVSAFALTAGSWMFAADQPATAPATARAARGLPKPKTEGGMPLMEALSKRHSSREFDARKLPDQVLSNLLWAAWGVNRPDGRRTAPSAVNWQEIEIYVAMADGLWLFDAKANDLVRVSGEDMRALAGKQAFVKDAPANLIYVADFAKMPKNTAEADKVMYSAADTGFISQNVYLFCASEGLSTVVRGMIDRPELAKAMGLREDQRIVLSQTVGYPR
jgi:nitroreductase